MKKLLTLCALFAATALSAIAQDNSSDNDKHDRRPPRPASIGIKGGFNVANITINNDGNVNDKHALPSFHIGLYGDFPLIPLLSLQPGVFLTGKGAKYTIGDDNSNNYTEVSTRPLYVEVPVNILVKIPLPNKVKLIAGAGPYAAMGVGGKNKTEGKLLGVSVEGDENIDYGNDDPQNGSNGSLFSGDTKRFDFGLNILAGLEIGHFTLNGNYGYGVVNIKPGSANNDAKYQNRVVGVSVGLMF